MKYSKMSLPGLLFFMVVSCNSPQSNLNSESEKKIDILQYLRQYEFDNKKSSDPNFKFPKLPKLDSLQAIELLKLYTDNPDPTSEVTLLVFLKFHFAWLQCCGPNPTNLTLGYPEIDTIQKPLLYLYLKISNQYQRRKMEDGIPIYDPYERLRKEDKFLMKEKYPNLFFQIDSLDNDNWLFLFNSALESKERDSELINRFIEEGKEKGWKIPPIDTLHK